MSSSSQQRGSSHGGAQWFYRLVLQRALVFFRPQQFAASSSAWAHAPTALTPKRPKCLFAKRHTPQRQHLASSSSSSIKLRARKVDLVQPAAYASEWANSLRGSMKLVRLGQAGSLSRDCSHAESHS